MTTPRQALIKKVHVAKRALAMHDDDYRAMLLRLTGKTSSAVLDVASLETVVDELRAKGWQEPAHYRRRKSQPNHVRMIYAQWLELGELGALKDPSKEALRAFVKRQTGVSAPEFLRNFRESAPVIEALKAMARRAREKKELQND